MDNNKARTLLEKSVKMLHKNGCAIRLDDFILADGTINIDHFEDELVECLNELGYGFNSQWEFTERYLPNYYKRDDILYLDICARYINDELEDFRLIEMMKDDFQSMEDAVQFVNKTENNLFLEALEEFVKISHNN